MSFFIDSNLTYLGASPDALNVNAMVRVSKKYSFVHQNRDPTEAYMDDHFHVT